ncbi:MAG: prolyl oligopeptidase family serine peptidase [Gammaproteobacteria bacterium]|nr:prolyl oligopeptidase family serine peptidase [Gammaproteobacteria bacterium]
MSRKTMRMFVGAAAVLVAALVIWGPTRATSPQFRPGLPIEALAETVWIEEFDISPDGGLLVFKSAAGGSYDLWTVPTAGGEPTHVTTMAGREMAPRFSPDGRWIAFEADFGGTDVRDIYVVPSGGGDPRRLTEHPLNDSGISWAPDSRRVYFNTSMFWDNSVAAVDIETGEIERVGPGGSGQLSADGSMFAFTRNTRPGDDAQSNQDVWVVPAAGGDPRALTPNTFDWRDTEPRWSPDGTRLAFVSDRNGFNNLGVLDAATGEATMLLTEDVEHSEPRWSPDGRWISFTRNLDYDYHIFRIPAEGGEPEQLTHATGVNGGSRATGQTRGGHLWHPDGEHIVYTHSGPSRTGDLWIIPVDGGEPRQITDHQHPAVGDPELFVEPEFIEYTSFDGLEVAGLIYKPKGASAGDRLPGLFFFRANSNGQHPKQWHPYIQYFVSRGYLVFAPNFRGSTGRGKAYRQAVHTHGGDHDLRDAFIGMDLLAGQGWVDPGRVGAFGGSTGGFYTTTAVTKDPGRFRAGIVWYGSTDLVTLSTYGGMEGWNRFLIGRTPMENPRNYYERSIIYHADEIDVPLLFLYAQGDGAARFQQIEQYGIQAEIHGNWYDWVVYGEEPHGWYHWGPASVRQSLEIMSAMFDTFILGDPYDVHAMAEQQREGIRIQRNPTIELWNSLVNGRPPGGG